MRIIALLLALAACSKGTADAGGGGRRGKGGGAGGGKLAYPVEVAPLVARKVVYSVDAPGSIDAYQTVQITARVAGAVDKVLFIEGQTVKAGDALASIESDRYQIAVAQAQSALAKAITTQKANQAALDRRVAAQKDSPGLVPGEEIEQKAAAVDSAKADVEAARQQLHVAELNLRDSQVRAPIDGVVQTRTVQLGQYLQPGAVLATIVQGEPLLVRFQVPEQDAPRLKPKMDAFVKMTESPRLYHAVLNLVSVMADPTTRLVPVTAIIDPVDEKEHNYWLRPGAFCEVNVPIGDARQGFVVPSLAVEPTEQGNVIYLVDDKTNIAHARVVEIGMHTPDGGVEVKGKDSSGQELKAGELLVVHGMEQLNEGAPVEIKDRTTLEAAQATPDAGAPQVTAPPVVPAARDGGAP